MESWRGNDHGTHLLRRPNFNQDIRGWFDIISKKANTKDIINNGTKAFVKHYSCDDTSDLSSCVPIVSHLEESDGFFGIPRYDPRTLQGFDDLEFGVNDNYTMMLVGQSLPGVAVAVFVLFFSFVFWHRRHWFESCFGRNACNWTPFSGTGLFFGLLHAVDFICLDCLSRLLSRLEQRYGVATGYSSYRGQYFQLHRGNERAKRANYPSFGRRENVHL